ncbi:MAG: monovalent cation/H(+) antiporter subunit G [Acidimicrobiales bacterium]
MSLTDVVSSALLVAGTSLAVIAGIGLQRFPDVFARMHAATKPATLGLVLVLAGAALRMERAGEVAKLLLVVALQFVTAPVGAHMVGRAAYRAGTELSDATEVDELAARGGIARPPSAGPPGEAPEES